MPHSTPCSIPSERGLNNYAASPPPSVAGGHMICMYVYVCMYVCIYIYRERENVLYRAGVFEKTLLRRRIHVGACGSVSIQSNKSGGEEQSPLQDCRATASVKGVFFQTPGVSIMITIIMVRIKLKCGAPDSPARFRVVKSHESRNSRI